MKIIYTKIFIVFCLFSLLPSGNVAQTPASYTSAEILLQLKKVNTLGSVLYIAAHPDDENTRLLAYLSKEKLYRTGYLSLTRGDGGQNLIGDEQGIELGLIRTQELLAARRIDGAEQFFTRAYDFGFSKTTEEALHIWDKEKTLYDVVWVIRKFQPDVIITRFPEDSRAGHGQHSGSAVLAHEAFKAAADPNRFAEQFKYGVQPWQAKRIVWNTFNFGNTNATSEDQYKIDVGVYNAILGKGYGEIAAESRSLHKSQGFGVARSRGQAFEYFTFVEGEPIGNDLINGVNTGWQRVQNAEKVQWAIDQLIASYSVTNPEKSVPALVNLYKEIALLKEGNWKNQKLKEVQRLIEICSGLWMESTTNNPYAVLNDSIRFNFLLNNRLGTNIVLQKISVGIFDTVYQQTLGTNRNFNFSKTILVPATKTIAQPYWLEQDMNEGSFNVGDLSQIGNPESKPSFEVQFDVRIEGHDFNFTRPVLYKFTDPVKGELYQPVTLLPAITGRFEPSVVLLNSSQEKAFDVIERVQSRSKVTGKPVLENTGNVSINFRGNFANATYSYGAKRTSAEMQVKTSRLSFEQNGKSQTAYELRTISYDHIPRLDYFHTPAIKLVTADIKIVGRRIGYIEGAGDKVPDALLQMGYEVIILKEKDITPSFLKTLDAVITGIRAYNVHEFMNDKYEILMEYVKEGGNLIAQYSTSNFVSSLKSKIGPYPFSISRNRVTEEKAKINFLNPSHIVLNYPNRITDADFDNWIQERGIYFAADLDPKYETILSMKDTGEQEQKGSLIIAEYGRGKFVYTGLVFFRQLPAGVPGAYRLLANIIALNKKKGF
ncbi:MAG: PIG-L family deacetylase [Chitinophagaceae bacterium]|nr:PIG-L family deacetylase [Chitinophagaceae bacterium]